LCFIIPVVSNYTYDREFGFILGCITGVGMIFITSEGGLLDKISYLLGWTEAREKQSQAKEEWNKPD
jgi:hypothetical protein